MRVFVLLLLLVSFSSGTAAQEVTGDINVTWRGPTLVSVSDKAQFFAGQELKVTISGSIDVNPDQRSRRDCDFLGISCTRVHWTEHHYTSPGSLQSRLILQRVDDPADKLEYIVNSSTTISVPASADKFERPFALYAYIAAPGTNVDPGRSVGSFSVSIGVNSAPRAGLYQTYLNARSPQASDIVDNRNVVDRMLRETHAQRAAQLTREYALRKFPLTEGDEAKRSQLALLRFCQMLAPGDLENTRALAEYYATIGARADADKAYSDLIKGLQAKVAAGGTSRDKATLAGAYAGFANNLVSDAGIIDPTSIQRADDFYNKAADAYKGINFPDLFGQTVAARASLLRKYRSRKGLVTALQLYGQAQDSLARTLAGDEAYSSIDGNSTYVASSYDGFSVRTLGGTEAARPFSYSGRDLLPVAYDAYRGRLLLREKDALQWTDPFDSDKKLSQSGFISGDMFQAANGTVLARDSFFTEGRVRVLVDGELEVPLKITNEERCAYAQLNPAGVPTGQTGYGYGPAKLSFDGASVFIQCGSSAAVKRIAGRSVVNVATLDFASLLGPGKFTLDLAIANKGEFIAALTRRNVMAVPGGPLRPLFEDEVIVWKLGAEGPTIVFRSVIVEESPVGFPLFRTITFTPDSDQLVLVSDRKIKYLDRTTGEIKKTIDVFDPKDWNEFPEPSFRFSGIAKVFWSTRDWMIYQVPFQNSFVAINRTDFTIVEQRLNVGAQVPDFAGLIVVSPSDSKLAWIEPRRYLSVSALGRNAEGKIALADKTVEIDVPWTDSSLALLSGGKYFVGREITSHLLSLSRVADGKSQTFSGKRGESLFAVPTPKDDVWVKVSTDSRRTVTSIVLVKGFDEANSINLPPVPPSVVDSFWTALKPMVDPWVAAGRPAFIGSEDTRKKFLQHPADLEEALAHKDRATFHWKLTSLPGDAVAENAGLLMLEPTMRFATVDGRTLTAPVMFGANKFAVLDFDDLAAADTVAATIADGQSPMNALGRSEALVMEITPPANKQVFVRSLINGARAPLSSKFSGQSSSMLPKDVWVSRDRSKFVLSGITGRPSGGFDYWTEVYKRGTGSTALLPCSECNQQDYTDLAQILPSVDFRATKVPAGSVVMVPFWTNYLKFDRNVGKTLFLTRDYLVAVDIPSNKTLLTAQPALPVLIENNIAVTKNQMHQLKLYDLTQN